MEVLKFLGSEINWQWYAAATAAAATTTTITTIITTAAVATTTTISITTTSTSVWLSLLYNSAVVTLTHPSLEGGGWASVHLLITAHVEWVAAGAFSSSSSSSSRPKPTKGCSADWRSSSSSSSSCCCCCSYNIFNC